MARCCQLPPTAANDAAAQQASTARDSLREIVLSGMDGSVKVRQLTEENEAVVDFLARQGLQPLCAEAFDCEGTHHAAVKHGSAKGGRVELGLGRQVAEEAAGKAVARASWIDNLFQR